jgi:3-oxoadipate enol-lactonase
MPFADLPNARIHYALSGDPSSPRLDFSNPRGATPCGMPKRQSSKAFYLLRYDMRGHGKSPPLPPSSLPVSQLTIDILESR